MSKTSPTARTLAECKRRGWTAAIVEKWNPHARIRQDLFGCIDIVALAPPVHRTCECSAYMEGECACGTWADARGTIIGIQACAGASHSARLAKAKAEPRLKAWLDTGATFLVWSWAKRGPRGKRKTWTLREEAVTL